MSMKVKIAFEGLDSVISNLSRIEETAPQNIEKQLATLARNTVNAWQGATPMRSGRLRGGEKGPVGGMGFELTNETWYYDLVNDGHSSPHGWQTPHGYRMAKHVTEVPGKNMTTAAVQYIEENILQALSGFLGE